MVLDRPGGEEQPGGDLAGGQRVGDEDEHVELTAGDAEPAQGRGDGRPAAPATDRRGARSDQQCPAFPGDPVVAALGEERLGLPQPTGRFAPAVPDGRLGYEAQAVPRPIALTDRRTGPVQRGARVGAATLPAEHDGVDQGERSDCRASA